MTDPITLHPPVAFRQSYVDGDWRYRDEFDCIWRFRRTGDPASPLTWEREQYLDGNERLAASAGRETEPLDDDDRDEADAILQSVLVMLGLPGFRKEWFVNDRWNFGALRQHGLDARLAEIRAAEKLAAGRETAPPEIACPACGEIVRQVSSATLALALWQHYHWTCKKAAGRETPAPPAEPSEWTQSEIVAIREDFEAWLQKRRVSPEVFAFLTPWRHESSTSASAGDTK